MAEDRSVESGQKRTLVSALLGVTGILLYAIVGWLYLGSGLVMPYPWVYGMWAIWVGGLFALVKVVKRFPAWTPLVPLVALAAWVAIIQSGSWLFGWTA